MTPRILLICSVAVLAGASVGEAAPANSGGSWLTAPAPRAPLLPEDIHFEAYTPVGRARPTASAHVSDGFDAYGAGRLPAPRGLPGPALRELLRKGRFEAVEEELLRLHSHGWLDEGRSNSMSARVAEILEDTSLLERLDEWVEARPESFLPYLLRGRLLMLLGWEPRGTALAGAVTNEQSQEHGRLLRRSYLDLQKAKDLGPSVPATWASWINVRRAYGQKEGAVRGAFLNGLKVGPNDLELFEAWLTLNMYKWGGSDAQMYQVARQYGGKREAPHLALLVAEAITEKAGWEKDAVAFLEKPGVRSQLDEAHRRAESAHPRWARPKISRAGIEQTLGRSASAARLYHEAALLGDRPTRRALVESYMYGTEEQQKLGLSWVMEDARAGHIGAGVLLASLYANGVGVERNESAAIQWLEWAAGRGSTDAMVMLSNAYTIGLAVEPNPEERKRWLKAAADRWKPEGLLGHGLELLGVEPGNGLSVQVPKDSPEGMRYLSRAAALGSQSAILLVSTLAEGYEASHPPPGRDPEAYASTREALGRAHFTVARLLWFSTRKWDDKTIAHPWIEKAMDLGVLEAPVTLGDWYRRGHMVEKDPEATVRWYKKAAQAGYPRGQNALGWTYMVGFGVRRDPVVAHGWFVTAAENGRVSAQIRAARMYEGGMGIPRDTKKARFWYEKAAAAGGEEAKQALKRGLAAQPKEWPSWAGRANWDGGASGAAALR